MNPYYEDKWVTIYNENCLDTMKRMDDSLIDLTVTSPPYDNLRAYNGYSFDFESIAKGLYRVTKQGGVVVWVVGDATINGSETGSSFRQALYFKGIGFNLHDTMIYRTNKPPLTHNRYEQCWEFMFIFSMGSPKTWNPILIPSQYAGQKRTATMRQDSDELNNRSAKGTVREMRIKENIWYMPRSSNSDGIERFRHPATFPDQLANDHIISWSNEGDLVFDPFVGSGTTLKMAKLNNRKSIGVDISEEYCQIAKERCSQEVMVFEKEMR